MSRRLAPFAATLVALIILAACAGGQTLTDPKEIITQGYDQDTAIH